MEIESLAAEDLEALKTTRAEARQKAFGYYGRTTDLAGVAAVLRENQAAYQDLASEGFSVRVDASRDSGTERYYLTKARTSLIVGPLKVLSWTAPLARLRVFDPGEEDAIRLPRGQVFYRLDLRGRYVPLDSDLVDGLYEAKGERATFESARALIELM